MLENKRLNTRCIAEFAPLDFWQDDKTKRGYIPVRYQSNISYAKPIFQLGQFIVPSKTFVELYSNFIGVVVEPLNNNQNELGWSGFTYISDLTEDFGKFYPDMKMFYFDENWTFTLNNFKEEEFFRINYKPDKTRVEVNRKKDEEFIQVFDGVHENNFLMNKKGIVLQDKFENKIETTENGIKITDKNQNTIEMNSSGIEIKDKFGHSLNLASLGTTLDGEFIVLNPFVNWVNSSAPNWGVGNLGAPSPIFPSNLAKLISGIVPGQQFVSNKPQS